MSDTQGLNISAADLQSGVITGINRFINNRRISQNAPSVLANDEIVYNSYAGVDIVAEVILPGCRMTLGELQTISYSVHRENTPVRLVGHTNVSGFVRGPRTVAGSMIFTTFNYYAWYRLSQLSNLVFSPNDRIYPLADMLPPFDVVLTFSNEYGSCSSMILMGLTIIDEGGAMSIDDLLTESTLTWMARGIQPLLNMNPSTLDQNGHPLIISNAIRMG